MGISSTKRGIRTWAATEEYRDNWDQVFGDKPTVKPLVETHGNYLGWCCGTMNLDEWKQSYKENLRDYITQDIEVAEEVLVELGYEKKKAPTPVKESGPECICRGLFRSAEDYRDHLPCF